MTSRHTPAATILSGPAPEAAVRSRSVAGSRHVLAAAPLLAAACAIVGVRALLGFQFPVPWPDETGFVAPAFDFARSGSFFDPGMNPDRVVMWMPPGYMLLLAAVFRVFGYSYALARWVSAVSCLASLGLVAALAVRLASGWRRVLAAWAVGLAFLTPYMLIDANIARMEMLLCAIMLVALTALVAGKPYIALSAVAAGAVVHFNAVYFAPVVLVDGGARLFSRRLRRPGAADMVALAAAAAGVGLYGAYILRHLPGFAADMRVQFAAKYYFGQNDPSHPLWIVIAGAAMAALVAWQRRAVDAAMLTALFGLAFVVMAHGGHEMWYDYGQPLGFALTSVALFADRNIEPPAATWPVWAGAACAALVIAMGLRITPAMAPLLPRWAMLHRNIVAPAEIARVRAFIATLPPAATVNFGWSGMELFFLSDLARAGAHWSLFNHSVTQLLPLRRPDWHVVCDSKDWPALLLQFDIDHPRHAVDSGCQIYPMQAPR